MRRLAGLHMLLVIDNFEQVLAAAPVVADLLQRAPRLHVLVTSRVVLRLRGEQEWRVDPLGVLPAGVRPGGAGAGTRRAVVRRAGARCPSRVRADGRQRGGGDRAVPPAGRPPAGPGARGQLDAPAHAGAGAGAARSSAWTRPGGLVDLPDRQQTLTATLQWSYDLLPQSAQQLLARLSVFAAPFTAEAAEAVCGRDDASATENLATLLDYSMVSPAGRPDGERAFRLLEVIRRFAAGRLEDPDETLSRLESYLLGVLEGAGAGHGSQDWARRRLDSEQPNLQVVLSWTAERRRSPARCCGGSEMRGCGCWYAGTCGRARSCASRSIPAGGGAAQREGPAGVAVAAGYRD